LTSYVVTLYKLFLGDQQDPTGHFQLGYTIHTIEMAIFPRGTAISIGTGYYTRYSQTGFTEYNVDEGDVVLDSFGKYYQVLSLKPWTSGDELAFYECELEERPVFPFIAGFFGFEDLEHGTIGYGYADGYERGYFAL
jgi:hypothetical protein